jgi:NAD-dependent dihydropyrimidine dehydrogenase PreA subunit
MESITRRSLIGGTVAGIGAAGLASAGIALSAESAQSDDSAGAESESAESGSTIEFDASKAYSPDLNMRGDYGPDIEDKVLARVLEEPKIEEDLTLPDGRVVPAIYVQLRNRLNRVGFGCGSEVKDTSWDMYMYLWTEQDAEICCAIPLLQWFTAYDCSVATGMSVDDSAEALESMANRGLISRAIRGQKPYYTLQPYIAGYWETTELIQFYQNGEDPFACEDVLSHNGIAKDYAWGFSANTFSECTSDPISIDVIAEDQFMPYMDWRQRIRNNKVVGVAACQCMIRNKCIDGTEYPERFPLKRCLYLGESGEYFISIGAAEEITIDEAIEIGEECVEAGMVPEHVSCADSDIICFCHCEECNQLQSIKALEGQNPVAVANYNAYTLNYDPEVCIGCGSCVDRCPMFAITLDEDNKCVMSDVCVRCGQCVSVCPVGARILVARDDYPYEKYPYDYQIDHQVFFAKERMQRGLIRDFTDSTFPTE